MASQLEGSMVHGGRMTLSRRFQALLIGRCGESTVY